jgi:alpha-N-arabinofuranosidase
MSARNTFENPNAVQPATLRGVRIDGKVVRATIPAKSVVVLAMK